MSKLERIRTGNNEVGHKVLTSRSTATKAAIDSERTMKVRRQNAYVSHDTFPRGDGVLLHTPFLPTTCTSSITRPTDKTEKKK